MRLIIVQFVNRTWFLAKKNGRILGIFVSGYVKCELEMRLVFYKLTCFFVSLMLWCDNDLTGCLVQCVSIDLLPCSMLWDSNENMSKLRQRNIVAYETCERCQINQDIFRVCFWEDLNDCYHDSSWWKHLLILFYTKFLIFYKNLDNQFVDNVGGTEFPVLNFFCALYKVD